MSNKEDLRAFVAKYGELALLKDLASIFNEWGEDWKASGEKAVGYTLSDSANAIVDVANRLESAENAYAQRMGTTTQEELMHAQAEKEFKSLMTYFENLTIPDLRELYEKNKSELMSKLKRLEFLKKFLDKKNDSK